jgi:hypothetical protein
VEKKKTDETCKCCGQPITIDHEAHFVETREKVCIEIKDYLAKRIVINAENLEAMCKAQNLNDLMNAKAKLLADMADGLPLGPAHCYFCMEPFFDGKNHPNGRFYITNGCKTCHYGIVHGICAMGTNSTYNDITVARDQLKNLLTHKFWTGNEMEQFDIPK